MVLDIREGSDEEEGGEGCRGTDRDQSDSDVTDALIKILDRLIYIIL